jgi:hypothetical protein
MACDTPTDWTAVSKALLRMDPNDKKLKRQQSNVGKDGEIA